MFISFNLISKHFEGDLINLFFSSPKISEQEKIAGFLSLIQALITQCELALY